MLSLDGALPLVWRGGHAATRRQVAAAAVAASRVLPAGCGPVINLCTDRYRFLIGLLAALHAGQRTILPPSAAPGAVSDVAQREGATLVLDDAWIDGNPPALKPGQSAGAPLEVMDDERTAVSLFTSGTTGAPKACHRHWTQLVQGAEALRRALALDGDGPGCNLVATVPAQHMFGLESSIMLPLATGHAMASGRPLFPEDVRSALASMPEPRALLTTPLHVRACVEAGLPWPPVRFVLTATARMPQALAERAERALAAPLLEVFGSTETGALASRRPCHEALWTPLPGVTLQASADGHRASGPHFPSCLLDDQLAVGEDSRFRLVGRSEDMVKVGGKRASLGELNTLLRSLDGVHDAELIRRHHHHGNERLLGLVVAPALSAAEIRRRLQVQTDPVFIPRPLINVDRLPRDATGKLPLAALDALLAEYGVTR